ncbi:HalOD1 output domain-containing protein [Natrinema sp. H-ect4]|uniref:HalOD1 output domain-containing protein n=1 Tax=Natrinema sp. H-ect4 TaxID=3242699 RepID=UPI0035A9945A
MPPASQHSDGRSSPSEDVVTAVATVFDESPIELTPPLYEAVDPEALDSLVDSGPTELRIRFRYRGCNVSVDGNGRVEVSPLGEGSPSHEHTLRDE